MSLVPKVKRMMMFKHGVAYLEHSGPAQGSFELSFKLKEMNDVLKSLTVWVAKGEAQVAGIVFDAPEDPEKALIERKLNFAPGKTLLGLLGSLRGRAIVIFDGQRTYQGEVVGYENYSGGDNPEQRHLILRASDGQLSIINLTTIKSLQLLEKPSTDDLQFLIDRARAITAGENRLINISLSGQAEDLRLSYVIPAPVWRVSYRLAITETHSLLMAWGIIHNPTEENLENIELTLTTGQPVSFTIDLYNPKRISRTVVEEQSRLANAPISYQSGVPMPAAAQVPLPPQQAMPQSTTGTYPTLKFDRPMIDKLSEDTFLSDSAFGVAPDATITEDRSEFFEYRVAMPISLKRGGSAMVPLISTKLDGKKERIWRDGTRPNPDLILSFNNNTGMVLEEGPVVIYDEGSYAGESMLPYSARGVSVKLGFAKDLAVRCRRTSGHRTVVSAIKLGKDALTEEQRREEEHSIWIENDHHEEVELIIELTKYFGHSIAPESLPIFEETSSFWRFRITLPPHSKKEHTIIERWLSARYISYNQLNGHTLSEWFKNRFLDKETHNSLSEIVATWDKANQLDHSIHLLEQNQQTAYQKQTKLTQQLSVLHGTGPEGDLRLRYVKELEAEQDKINEYEQEINRLKLAAEDARRLAANLLANLVQ